MHRSVDNNEEQEMTSRQLRKSQHQPVSDLAKSKCASRLVKVETSRNKKEPRCPTKAVSYEKLDQGVQAEVTGPRADLRSGEA